MKKGMSASCTILGLSYGEWYVVMASMLTFESSRLMGGSDLLAEEFHFRRLLNKTNYKQTISKL